MPHVKASSFEAEQMMTRKGTRKANFLPQAVDVVNILKMT